MEVQPEEKEKTAFTTKNDPRVTGIGQVLNQADTSIDELPQLFTTF